MESLAQRSGILGVSPVQQPDDGPRHQLNGLIQPALHALQPEHEPHKKHPRHTGVKERGQVDFHLHPLEKQLPGNQRPAVANRQPVALDEEVLAYAHVAVADSDPVR